MVTEFETKRFATVPWVWGLLVAFALVMGFAAPSYALADDSTQQQVNAVAAEKAVALFEDSQASALAATDAPKPEVASDGMSAAASDAASEAASDAASDASSLQDATAETADARKNQIDRAETTASNAFGGSAGKQTQYTTPPASDSSKGQGAIADTASVSPDGLENDVLQHGSAQPNGSVGESIPSGEHRADADEQDASGALQAGSSKAVGTSKNTDAPQATTRSAKGKAAQEQAALEATTQANAASAPASAAHAANAAHVAPASLERSSAWVDSAYAYDEAADSAQETAIEQPVEQPVETIAPPVSVRYLTSTNTAPGVPCGYIGAAPTHVDAPAPSSLFALVPDQGAHAGIGSARFTAGDRNLHATLLFRKARCRSP